MPNPTQVTGDEDPFLNELNDIEEKIATSRRKVNGTSLTKVCLDCGADIGSERLKAIPSATTCISCANGAEEPKSAPRYVSKNQRRLKYK